MNTRHYVCAIFCIFVTQSFSQRVNGELIIESTVGAVNMSLSTQTDIYGHASIGYPLTTSYNNLSISGTTDWAIEHIRSGYPSYAYAEYDLTVDGSTITLDVRDCDYCDQLSDYGTDYVSADIFIRYNGGGDFEVQNAVTQNWFPVDGTVRVQDDDRKTTQNWYTSCYGTPSAPTNLTISGDAGEHPHLAWDANSERDFYRYDVYLNVNGGGWFLYATVSTNSFDEPEFVIGPEITEYEYRVKARDRSGLRSNPSNTVSVWGIEKRLDNYQKHPDQFSLSDNYPNPFNPITTINFGLPEESITSLIIYNLLGREIKRLFSGLEQPGFKQITWNGTDQNGNPVPSGIFIYRLTAISRESEKTFTQSQKMILLK